MESERIIGRNAECDRLQKCLDEVQAQLVLIYGRRRVGKTFLINKFFEGRFDFKFTGAYNESKEVQLKNFVEELNLHSGEEYSAPKDWSEAFSLLKKYLMSKPKEEKKIVFFDEMPWMDTKRSGFISAFEWFWNGWGSAEDNLIFIVCGSATSWMMDNISGNKGGLFNRKTCSIYLQPFTLREVEEYLTSRNISWSRYDIAECYMIFGGIPYYLSLLDSEMTLGSNVDNLLFKKRAELWDEFHNLYRTLFSNSEQYISVVEALSKKRGGMTISEISRLAKLPMNGALSKIMNNLYSSGFVRKYVFFNHKKRETIYQLADYYTLFYFKYIKDNYGQDEKFWSNAIDSPSRRAWAGFTYEQLCKDHIKQIKKKLGILGVLSEEYTWFKKSSKDSETTEDGAQIDIIIDRRDRVINICEVKFSIDEYEIDKTYDRVLRNKIESFRTSTDTKKTLQLTMITTYGVKANKYSNLVNTQVVLDDLFEEA